MSATGRGTRGGEGLDYFPTPAPAVRSLLDALPLRGGRWLEPGAGDGAIIRAVDDWRQDHAQTQVFWRAVEVNPARRLDLERSVWRDSGEVVIEDFFKVQPERFDVAIMNPAFHLSERVITACFEQAPVVVSLEKLNFLGSRKRAPFWRRHPADVYVLSERPFPDMTEYAWFVWGQCGSGPGRVQVLGPPETMSLLAGV